MTLGGSRDCMVLIVLIISLQILTQVCERQSVGNWITIHCSIFDVALQSSAIMSGVSKQSIGNFVMMDWVMPLVDGAMLNVDIPSAGIRPISGLGTRHYVENVCPRKLYVSSQNGQNHVGGTT